MSPRIDTEHRVPKNDTKDDTAVQQAREGVIVPEFGDAGGCEEAEG
jgi:hypothetical protein